MKNRLSLLCGTLTFALALVFEVYGYSHTKLNGYASKRTSGSDGIF